MNHCVYFIRSGENGPIKIGKATGGAESRLSDLQTGNPERLTIVATVPGGLAVEAMFHRRFAAYRRPIGEWFDPGPELLAFIDGIVWGNKGGTVSEAAMRAAELAEDLFEDQFDPELEPREPTQAEADDLQAALWEVKFRRKNETLAAEERVVIGPEGWEAAATALAEEAPPALFVARVNAINAARAKLSGSVQVH